MAGGQTAGNMAPTFSALDVWRGKEKHEDHSDKNVRNGSGCLPVHTTGPERIAAPSLSSFSNMESRRCSTRHSV